MQYRYLRTPVRSLPGQPDLGLDSVDSFTRLDAHLSARHTLIRPWRVGKYRFSAGLKVYNALADGAERDVQTNLAAPDFGRAYNPIRRSIGLALSSGRP